MWPCSLRLLSGQMLSDGRSSPPSSGQSSRPTQALAAMQASGSDQTGTSKPYQASVILMLAPSVEACHHSIWHAHSTCHSVHSSQLPCLQRVPAPLISG